METRYNSVKFWQSREEEGSVSIVCDLKAFLTFDKHSRTTTKRVLEVLSELFFLPCNSSLHPGKRIKIVLGLYI